MAAVLDVGRHTARIAQLDAARRQARFWRYLRYALLALVVAWSVEAIVELELVGREHDEAAVNSRHHALLAKRCRENVLPVLRRQLLAVPVHLP